MNKREIKEAHKIFSPDNKTRIKRIGTLNKDVCILETRQLIKDSRFVFPLSCFEIQYTNISICGKYLQSTQYCKNIDYLKSFVNYNLKNL